jgi:phosphodiesterase/alkaline phosphatase D-like protein
MLATALRLSLLLSLLAAADASGQPSAVAAKGDPLGVPILEVNATGLPTVTALPSVPSGSDPLAPMVVTEPASSVTQISAVLNATTNPNGTVVEDCHFEYGTSTSYGFNLACSSLPGSGSSPVAVSASLLGLSANTSYHFRIVAGNAGGTSYGGDQPLRTPPKPPKVITGAASSITQTSATLNATVNPNGGEVSSCMLEYGMSTSYGWSVACSSLPGSGENPVAVAAPLADLSANTLYHFRLAATNPGGTSYGSDETFSSLPNPPALRTEAASAVTQTTATLNAAMDLGGGLVTSCIFEYGASTLYGSSIECASLPGSGAGPVAVSALLQGLSASTTYHFRILASGAGGSVHGADETFQTLPDAPTVVTGAASTVAQTTATLNGTVDPNGGTVSSCELEYGTSTLYGAGVPCASLPGSGGVAVAVSAQVAGLIAGTTYYFRVVAANPGGTSYGADQALTALQQQPSQGVLPSQVRRPPPTPDAELASTALTADSSGTFTVRVTCPAGESSCSGTIALRTLTAVSASSTGRQANISKARILTLASGPFKLAGGHVKTIKLHLSAKARKLLAHSHVLRARATIVAHDPAGGTHTARTLVTIVQARVSRSGKG